MASGVCEDANRAFDPPDSELRTYDLVRRLPQREAYGVYRYGCRGHTHAISGVKTHLYEVLGI